MKKPNENNAPAALETDEPASENGIEPDKILDILRLENEQLRENLRMQESRDVMTSVLADAGAHSPKLLFEAARSNLQFDPDGRLENAAAVLDNLRKSFPEQFGKSILPVSIDAGAGRPSGMRLTKESLAKMSPSEIAALNWEDVGQVLAAR